jgi:hypothetical protein
MQGRTNPWGQFKWTTRFCILEHNILGPWVSKFFLTRNILESWNSEYMHIEILVCRDMTPYTITSETPGSSNKVDTYRPDYNMSHQETPQFSYTQTWKISVLNMALTIHTWLTTECGNATDVLCSNLVPFNVIWGGGTRWRSCLRQCAASRKVAVLIPDGVTGIFHWHNPFGRTMVPGSTQPLTEMCTRAISFIYIYQLYVLIVLKSGSLTRLEPSGPAQACNGIALPLLCHRGKKSRVSMLRKSLSPPVTISPYILPRYSPQCSALFRSPSPVHKIRPNVNPAP